MLARQQSESARNRLSFHWAKGAATTVADFGDPINATSYALCVYDETGGAGTATLKLAAGIPAGSGGWKTTSRGFRYSNRFAVPDGIKKLTLVGGSVGNASIMIAGKGQLLVPGLPYQPKVTAQLRASNGKCWDAMFSAPTTNDASQFHGKSD